MHLLVCRFKQFLLFSLLSAGVGRSFAGGLAVLPPPRPTAMEDYAAKELTRYIHLLSGEWLHTAANTTTVKEPGYILGRPGHHPVIDRLLKEGRLQCTPGHPGPQGYILKKLTLDGYDVIVIAANDETGLLYGVYGLLEEHLGISFSFDGDLLPTQKTNLFPDIDEVKTPAVAIRGLLPWTNFPQSATSYSWDDWKYILDQMAKMRLNFLHIHNYSGEEGHNEMFHNFEAGGKLSRVWMATARSGHAWGSYPGWDPNKYLFGAASLFDDYDFGADCALHNEKLSNRQVFRKGVNEFQRVIAYAHTRGIKIGLGLDINLIPASYQLDPADPRVITARVNQLQTDYPDLDYLLCFQSESLREDTAVQQRKTWRAIFDGFYTTLKKSMPALRLAVAGWGIRAVDVATLPPDVICAPISFYSDGCESGSVYGTREYWGCPWLERDFNSSVYYYPYNMDLSNTIKAWQSRAPNMKGFYALTWRLTDAVKAKVWFMSRAPWDDKNELNNSEALYSKFAAQQYGASAAAAITPIINQNEPFASDFSECRWTPPFLLARVDRRAQYLVNLLSFTFTITHERGGNATGAISSMEKMATSFSRQNHTRNGPGPQPGQPCVGYITAGSWLAYDSVNFNPGFTHLILKMSSATDGGRLELRLDAPNGPKIGEGELLPTGAWQTWKEATLDLQPATGAHTLYLVFRDRDPALLAQAQADKAQAQLQTIATAIRQAATPGQKYRLSLLENRIAAERDHILLNMYAANRSRDINDMTRSWVSHFTGRVSDISSLGNIVSLQNRFIQKNYIDLAWKQLNTYNTLAPGDVQARGTKEGARITWQTTGEAFRGYDIYRDGEKITARPLPAATRQYDDITGGFHRYEVYSLLWGNDAANGSASAACYAGAADTIPPQIVVISPPSSVLAGQPLWVKAHLLDNRLDGLLSAVLCYRAAGATAWTRLPMTRKIKSTFTAAIPAADIPGGGIEYYITATDGDNETVFPADAPAHPLSIVQEKAPPGVQTPATPAVAAQQETLQWPAVKGAAAYRIYRASRPEAAAGPETLLTYIAADAALQFTDNGLDFEGQPLTGPCYYRVTAVDAFGYESPASGPIAISYKPAQP